MNEKYFDSTFLDRVPQFIPSGSRVLTAGYAFVNVLLDIRPFAIAHVLPKGAKLGVR
jgi:hypothetical protein